MNFVHGSSILNYVEQNLRDFSSIVKAWMQIPFGDDKVIWSILDNLSRMSLVLMQKTTTNARIWYDLLLAF